MKFAEALKYFEKGYTIRRSSWPFERTLNLQDSLDISVEDLLAADWEVVKMQFHEVLNLMLTEQKSIHRFSTGDGITNAIQYINGKIYQGLGTRDAHEYKFTQEDMMARDWVIQGT